MLYVFWLKIGLYSQHFGRICCIFYYHFVPDFAQQHLPLGFCIRVSGFLDQFHFGVKADVYIFDDIGKYEGFVGQDADGNEVYYKINDVWSNFSFDGFPLQASFLLKKNHCSTKA